ncbi:MAG: hypothetical protein ACPLW9_02405 [Minisyncoccales bacterium]
MLWLLAAILAYFLLAIVSLVDKYLLATAIPNPKVYAFYVGVLGLLVLALVPWTGFVILSPWLMFLSLLSGFFFIYALFWYYRALQLFEASRVIPAMGAFIPVFSFLLIFLFSRGQESLSGQSLLALVILITGSILITLERKKLVTLKSLKFSALAAFFLALSFVLIKYVYLEQPFWFGFIWRCLGGFLTALLFFLIFPEIKTEIFKNKILSQKKKIFYPSLFLLNQTAGAGANILQNWATFLAPLIYVPFVYAISGLQYVFLFIFSLFLSLFFSFWIKTGLKEEISLVILIQKIIAILLIGLGLALLFL